MNCGKAGQIAPDLLIFQDMSITQILMWILYIFKWWLWCDEANPLLSKLTHSPGGSKGPQFDTCRVELDQVADSSLSSRCWCPGKLPRWATPSSKGCLLSLFAKKCSFCKPLKKFLLFIYFWPPGLPLVAQVGATLSVMAPQYLGFSCCRAGL